MPYRAVQCRCRVHSYCHSACLWRLQWLHTVVLSHITADELRHRDDRGRAEAGDVAITRPPAATVRVDNNTC